MIVLDPRIPFALWFPLALLTAAAIGTYAFLGWSRIPRGRRWLVALMALGAATPLLILLNPSWVQAVPPPAGRPLLTILIDRSGSMATPDATGGATRFAAASEEAARFAEELEGTFDVRVREFSDRSSATELSSLDGVTPEGDVTDLSRAIEDALGENRPLGQSLLLLSDGADTADGRSSRLRRAADKAKALNAPIFARTFGSPRQALDLAVELDLSQELSFVGQRTPVTVRLRGTHATPQRTRLTLTLDGQEVESRDVELPVGETAEETLYVQHDASGVFRYEIAAAPIPGEATDLNNATTLSLRVVDEPVSALLLEGKPYWDTKFLVRTLAADPSVELTSVVQIAPGRLVERRIERLAPGETGDEQAAEDGAASDSIEPEGSPETHAVRSRWLVREDSRSVLADAEYLAGFQIVILGRNTEVFLTDEALAVLRRWLQENEGSLVCFRGSPEAQLDSRLAAVMPVRWKPGPETRFRVELTDSGASARWLPESIERLESLPSLAMGARPEEPRALTTVLAVGRDAGGEPVPLMTYRPEGNGRVVAVEGAGMWRWAFLPPEHQDHDAVYGALWRSLVRWLVSNVGLLPSERIALRPDAVTFRSAQPVTATLLLREKEWGSPPGVVLQSAEGEPIATFAPTALDSAAGVYQVNFGRLPEGRYSATAGDESSGEPSARTIFDVAGNLKERLESSPRPDVMGELARVSGGSLLEQADPAQLDREFQRHVERSRPERLVRHSAWDRWPWLAAMLGLWGVTWALRRQSGLT